MLILLFLGSVAVAATLAFLYRRGVTLFPTPPEVPGAVRDTLRAQRAMRIAMSYIDEVGNQVPLIKREPFAGAVFLPTLSLAAAQLREARKFDPDAIALWRCDNEDLPWSISDLEAILLFYEATCRSKTEPMRAIRIMEKACSIAPRAMYYHRLGFLNLMLYRQKQAIAALETALSLDPENIDIAKALDRARVMPLASRMFKRSTEIYDGAVTIKAWVGAVFSLFLIVLVISAVTGLLSGDPTMFLFLIVIVLWWKIPNVARAIFGLPPKFRSAIKERGARKPHGGKPVSRHAEGEPT